MDILKAIWNNPKHRNILILGILCLILIASVIYRIMQIKEPTPEGSLRVVVCTECKQTSIQRIKDIKDPQDKRNKCRECHGRLAIAWKCSDCKFEYPATMISAGNKNLKKTMDKFQAIVESRRCPNCSSLSAHPMSINELEKKK